MSENKSDECPAFPRPSLEKDHEFGDYYLDYGDHKGMTLRDYFAAKAMSGFLSDMRTLGTIIEQGDLKSMSPAESVSKTAYAIADAMLKERDK